jgi:hypothetical protein
MSAREITALNAEVDQLLDEYRKLSSRKLEKHFKDQFGAPLWAKSKWSTVLSLSAAKLPLEEKLALVASRRMPSRHSVFEYARSAVHETGNSQLKHDFDGCYRYWRYYREAHHGKFGLRWGVVKISTPDDYTMMEHWSFDALGELEKKHDGDIRAIVKALPEPEDTGIAIYTPRKLFMLGFRRHNIRLGIADLPRHLEQLANQPLRGLILTNKNDADLYSAAFVMFHEHNPDFGTALRQKKFSEYAREFMVHSPQYAISK